MDSVSQSPLARLPHDFPTRRNFPTRGDVSRDDGSGRSCDSGSRAGQEALSCDPFRFGSRRHSRPCRSKKAAGDAFDKLDTDKDGTLDRAELHGRLSHRDFAAPDPDNGETLTKDEYLVAVEQRFKSADPDGDGSVSAAEFATPAGHALAWLLS